jgi:hypothetical protein
MQLIDLDQAFAGQVLNEAISRLCQRFGWERAAAWEFLFGAAVAVRVQLGDTDAQIHEALRRTLAEFPASARRPESKLSV